MLSILLIFCYFVMAYGLCNLLVNGRGPYDVLTNMRDYAKLYFPGLGEMLDCMMCTGTNVGLVLSILSLQLDQPFTPFTILFDGHYWFLAIILDAFITSGGVWLLDAAELALERSGNTPEEAPAEYYDPGIEPEPKEPGNQSNSHEDTNERGD